MKEELLPKYKCHKVVRAGKIVEVWTKEKIGQGSTVCAYLQIKCGKRIHVREDYIKDHKPQAGGYYVEYEDGYESYSPAEVFEARYTLIEEDKDEVQEPSRDDLIKLYMVMNAAFDKSKNEIGCCRHVGCQRITGYEIMKEQVELKNLEYTRELMRKINESVKKKAKIVEVPSGFKEHEPCVNVEKCLHQRVCREVIVEEDSMYGETCKLAARCSDYISGTT